MSGSSDHPTPVEFLISINTLKFTNLTRSPDSENVRPGLLSSLLSIGDVNEQAVHQKVYVDDLLDVGERGIT